MANRVRRSSGNGGRYLIVAFVVGIIALMVCAAVLTNAPFATLSGMDGKAVRIDCDSTAWASDLVSFDAYTSPSFSSGRVVYQWDFGDGEESESEGWQSDYELHVYDRAGVYTVTLTIVDSSNQDHTSKVSKQIVVSYKESVSVDSVQRRDNGESSLYKYTYVVSITVKNVSPSEVLTPLSYTLVFVDGRTEKSYHGINEPDYVYSGWVRNWEVEFSSDIDAQPLAFIYGNYNSVGIDN